MEMTGRNEYEGVGRSMNREKTKQKQKMVAFARQKKRGKDFFLENLKEGLKYKE